MRERRYENTMSTTDEKLDGKMKRKAARCKRRGKDGTMKGKHKTARSTRNTSQNRNKEQRHELLGKKDSCTDSKTDQTPPHSFSKFGCCVEAWSCLAGTVIVWSFCELRTSKSHLRGQTDLIGRLESTMWTCPMLNCTQQPEDA